MLKDLVACCDSILFRPISTNAVCLFRIGLGLSVVVAAMMRCPDFLMWYGEHGLCPYSDVHKIRFIFSAWHLIAATDQNAQIVLVLLLAVLSLTVGLLTRFSTFLSYFLFTSLRCRNPDFWVSIDVALQMFLPIMFFAPAGEKFSVDQLIKKKFSKNYRERLYSPFAQRPLQFSLT